MARKLITKRFLDALRRYGHELDAGASSCSSCGLDVWSKDIRLPCGKRQAVLWPDADEPKSVRGREQRLDTGA